MAKFISNPTVSVAGTDISDHVYGVTVALTADSVETTAFGSTWRSRIPGLKSGQITINYHNDYAAGQASAVINPLLGSLATVVVSQLNTGGTLIGTAVCVVSQTNPVNGQVGDVSTSDVSWETTGSVVGFGL